MDKPENKAKKNILIAEDEKAYCHALVLKLQNAGLNAVGVGDGQEAIEVLKKEKFDLFILDLVMPKKNGFDVLEEMDKTNIKLPTIILSNLTQIEDKKRAEKFGIKGFIEKADTSILDIINKVQELLH